MAKDSKTADTGPGTAIATNATKADLMAKDDALAKKALKILGFGDDQQAENAPLETIQTGGVTKWVDLKAFQLDPNVANNEPVKGNGNKIVGLLLGRHEIEDDAGEENADGVKVRHFFTILTAVPCPVEFKDEDGVKQKGVAAPGDIVAIGERHQLRGLRTMAEDGGKYAVFITPHSRRRIDRGQTMWTFDVQRKTLRPAPVLVTKPLRF